MKQSPTPATPGPGSPPAPPPSPTEIAALVDKLVARWKNERSEIPSAQETTDVNLLRDDILNAVAALAEETKTATELRQKLAKAADEVLRAKADFVNYQERQKRETARLVASNTRSFVEALVPWLDNFELSLKTASATPESNAASADAESFHKAMQLTHDHLLQVLQGKGLKRYSAAGQRFDPALHESITKIPMADKFHGEVIEEVRPGYIWQDLVLRPASVVIADNPQKPWPLPAAPSAPADQAADATGKDAPAAGSAPDPAGSDGLKD